MPNQLQKTMSNLPPVDLHRETSGFAENWLHSFGQTVAEDLPESQLIPSSAESFRKNKLNEHYEAGRIPEDAWHYYTQTKRGDWRNLAEYANTELGLTDVPNAEDFDKQQSEEFSLFRKVSQEVFDRSNFMGKVGQMGGALQAYSSSPTYALSMLTGYGAATSALKVGIKIAATEALLETVAQPFILAHKREIGAEFTTSQALTNIITAGAGAGILGIGAIKAGQGIKYLTGFKDKRLDPIRHVLKNSDPEDFVSDVLKRDENVDFQKLHRAVDGDKDLGHNDLSVEEVDAVREQTFADRRASITQEKQRVAKKTEDVVGTEQVTKPISPETQRAMESPIVKQSITEVNDLDAKLKILEECF